ncbi:MAG TPA: sugar phosphate isomerase/epimerase family protein [Bryobacteraceae bacterium]|nr:sugar phosphate isomerase/epimerase family protein [Bryobacteraceae bacterium]
MPQEDPLMNRRDFARTAATAAGVLGSANLSAAEKAGANLKIGLYSITYLGVWYRGDALTLEQVIDRAKKFGYDGVEIDGKRPHGDPLDWPKWKCRDLRRYAEGQGIELYAIAANNDFSSPIPEYREACILYLRELLRMSADMQVKVVRVFSAWPGVTLLPGGGARYDIAGKVWAEAHKEFPAEQTWAWCRDGLKEVARYAADHGITLALQNHRPVINGYQDMLRMIKEVDAPNLKACFDARLEHEMGPEDVLRASREIGALQVLNHYGNEYDEVDGRIVLKEDELAASQVAGLLDIGYKGYMGYELCHALPVVNGQTVGIEFTDKNARLAASWMRSLVAETAKRRA